MSPVVQSSKAAAVQNKLGNWYDERMFEELKELIPQPGQYLLFDKPPVRVKKLKDAERTPKKLDIFQEREEAKRVFKTYVRCWDNAISLLHEARLLFQSEYYARAVAIGITAWEEMGKSQLAADYYSGVASNVEYAGAFKSHSAKSSYLVRVAIIDHKRQFGVASIPAIGEKLEKIRQRALYVSETNDPLTQFVREDAEFVLERVWEHMEFIRFAEEFNGRIGSKALFK